jgi:hypothetical protein
MDSFAILFFRSRELAEQSFALMTPIVFYNGARALVRLEFPQTWMTAFSSDCHQTFIRVSSNVHQSFRYIITIPGGTRQACEPEEAACHRPLECCCAAAATSAATAASA